MFLLRSLVTLGCLLIFTSSVAITYSGPELRVAVSRQPLQVVSLPLEEYLLGVLAAEMPADWPLGALQAQAVAARTYALYRQQQAKHPEYDVVSTVEDQVFRQQKQYPQAIHQAVRSTRGQVLAWQGQLIPAFFHSCSGGYTEQADRVWPWAKAWNFYRAQPDPYGKQCPDEMWELSLSKVELNQLLQQRDVASGSVDYVIPLMAEDNQRVQHLVLITNAETVELPGNQVRRLLGYDRLRSTRFNVLDMQDEVVFVGTGYGHGVGLSQWSARAMSEAGKAYRQILQFYYPGVHVKKQY